MSCYFYFVFVMSVMLYLCMLCVSLLMDMLSCLFDSVCELFGVTIYNMLWCCCYFVVECYGSV